MPKFRQVVIETRTYEVEYVVEAKNVEEAKDKIAIGDTIEEAEVKNLGVCQRDPWDNPTKLPRRKKEPPGIFDVNVCRTGYGFATIRVQADNSKEASLKALDVAGNFSYSEKDAEYSSQGVSKSQDQTSTPNVK